MPPGMESSLPQVNGGQLIPWSIWDKYGYHPPPPKTMETSPFESMYFLLKVRIFHPVMLVFGQCKLCWGAIGEIITCLPRTLYSTIPSLTRSGSFTGVEFCSHVARAGRWCHCNTHAVGKEPTPSDNVLWGILGVHESIYVCVQINMFVCVLVFV